MKHAIMTIVAAALLLAGCGTQPPPTDPEGMAAFHQSLYTVDTHLDTPSRILDMEVNQGGRKLTGALDGKLDIPRMSEGGLDGAFFVVWTPQGECNDSGYLAARQRAIRLFGVIRTFVDDNPQARLALNAADLISITDAHRHAIFIGMENGFPIGKDLSLLNTYYKMGTRYITLCHSSNNDICDSSTDPDGPRHGGLSDFGKQVVREMNRLGIMVDVSHISDASFFDVLAATDVPVIASHSDARAVCNHPRNMSDSMIVALGKHGGVIQVNLVPDFVREAPDNPPRDSARQDVLDRYGGWAKLDAGSLKAFTADMQAVDSIYPPAPATVSQLVDHIDHIVKLIGIDYVGIGSDFDGGGELDDCTDVSQMEHITAELIRRGYSRNDIRKIWSGNLLRVMRAVEHAAEH